MNSTKLKKTLAILILVICVPIQLLFMGVMITTLVSNDFQGGQIVLTFIFCMALFSFPIWWSVKVLRTGKQNVGMTLDDQGANTLGETITIRARMELPEYRRLLFRNTYRSPAVIFLHVIGISMIIFYLMNRKSPVWFPSFFGLFLLYLPISVHRTAANNYKSSKSLHEDLTFEFRPETIVVSGETYNTTMSWKTLYKIKDAGDWFMLYTNKTSAIIIPKKAFDTQRELNRFQILAGQVNES